MVEYCNTRDSETICMGLYKKVRDLIDSLYKGYPIGYILLGKNPSVKLKDGTSSEGKADFNRWTAKNNGSSCIIIRKRSFR